jgi:hypothetical protein
MDYVVGTGIFTTLEAARLKLGGMIVLRGSSIVGVLLVGWVVRDLGLRSERLAEVDFA